MGRLLALCLFVLGFGFSHWAGQAAAQSSCIPAPAGLVAWWPGEGNALDVGGVHPGVVVGGTFFAPARVGAGFTFDSNDDRVIVPHSTDLDVQSSGFTAALWMQGTKSQPEAIATLLEKSHGWTDNTGWAISVFRSDGEPHFALGDGAGFPDIPGGVDVLDGNPHHIAATWESGTMRLYVDGTLRGTLSNPATVNNTRDVNLGFTWGGGSPRRFFRGYLDEVQVFDRALSGTEIQAIVAAGAAGVCQPPPPPCLPAPANLIAWWPGEGSALDVAGSHHGALVGGTFSAPARVGTGFTFDSNDDRVIVPHSTDLDVQSSGFTAALWMQGTKSQPEALATLLEKSHGWIDNTGWAFQVERSSGVMRFGLGDGAGFTDLSGVIDVLDGNPHHLVGTWEAGTLRFYVDGVLRATAAHPTPFNNTRAVNLGFTWGGGSPRRFFRGYLDEVQVFDRALSETEIQAIVAAGAAGVCPPPPPPCVPAPSGLIGWWAGDGTAASLRGGHHGTLRQGATFSNGIVAQAFSFDGQDDKVEVASVSDLEVQAFTVDAWVMARSAGFRNDVLGGVIAAKDIGDTYTAPFGSWSLYGPGTTGLIRASVGLTDGSHHVVTSTRAFPFGQFHFVAMTWDGSTLSLYVNGQLEGTLAVGAGTVAYSGEPLTIGEHHLFPAARRAFHGVIDEVEFFDRALTAAEISDVYAAGTGGKCKTLAPPVVTAPADASYPCASQVPAAAPDQATATDDVAVVSLTVAESSNGGAGSPASPLVLTRTWTATDADGQTASDSQTITVIDATPPVLTIPADRSAMTGPGDQACADARLPIDPGPATATDNCGEALVTVTGIPADSLFSPGETLIAWTATDGAGNAVSDTQRVVVSCPVGRLTGSASLLCGGAAEPAANVTVRLLHEGTPFRTVSTAPGGTYAFEDVRLGTYTVAIEPPPGYAVAPDTRLVTLEQGELALEPFVFTCLIADLTGQVNGTCNGQTRGLQGITVDLFRDNGAGMDVLVGTTATDAQGAFRFEDLAFGEYEVGIVMPLGYASEQSTRSVTLATPNGTVADPFALTCEVIAACPRSVLYWKHQVNVYITGKGHAQESLDDLLRNIDLLVQHFNENLVNPVVIYVPGSTATQDKLLQLRQLLSINRNTSLDDLARQQLLTLMLNVVSGKISQNQIISGNGATVSQAITHMYDRIMDGSNGGDLAATAIGALVNVGLRVPSGWVPGNTRIIAYDRGPAPPTTRPAELSLAIAPHPVTAHASITLSLPGHEPAVLEVVDLAGRVVARERVESGAGVQTLRLERLDAIRPGVYLVRVRQGVAAQVRRMTVIR